MELHTLLLGLAVLVGAVFWTFPRLACSRNCSLPPGPAGRPLIGNLLDVPKEKEWLTYAAWAKTYGDILSLRVFGQTIVVLNSARDVRELFVARATNYSDRVRLTMTDMAGWREGVGIVPPGETFRAMRRFMTQLLGQHAINGWRPLQEAEIDAYILRLLASHGDLSRKTSRLTGSIILNLTYGYPVTTDDDPLVQQSEDVLRVFHTVTSPGWIVDMFPMLRHLPIWLPGMRFKRQVTEWGRLVEASRRDTLDWTKRQIASGNHVQCFAADLLADEDRMKHEARFALVLGDLYITGSETTRIAILSFLLHMALNPKVQLRAQAEIDSFRRGRRMPGYDERDKLPYVLALIKEVHRWHPVGPMGVPHCAASDDEYNGYLIPKGAIVFANVWSILHDPNKYPDPASFRPERYLETDPDSVNAAGDVINEDPTKYDFGFGTRQCPGRNLAQSTLFLAVTKILATCSISNAVDSHGTPLTPDTVEYLPGVASEPAPFNVTIKARSRSS